MKEPVYDLAFISKEAAISSCVCLSVEKLNYATDGHYIKLFAEQLTRTFEVLVLGSVTTKI